MSRMCQLTGKRTSSGNNRPFSLKATRRTFRPNLFNKRVLNPLTGRVEKMRLSAKAIRTLKKWAREGGHEENLIPVKTTTTIGDETKKKHVKKEKLTPKQKKELKVKEESQKKEEMKPEVVKEMEKAEKSTKKVKK